MSTLQVLLIALLVVVLGTLLAYLSITLIQYIEQDTEYKKLKKANDESKRTTS